MTKDELLKELKRIVEIVNDNTEQIEKESIVLNILVAGMLYNRSGQSAMLDTLCIAAGELAAVTVNSFEVEKEFFRLVAE